MAEDLKTLAPLYRTYRPYVSRVDGGFLYPMPSSFDPTLGYKGVYCVEEGNNGTWVPPEKEGVELPESDEDIAFLSVSGHATTAVLIYGAFCGYSCMLRAANGAHVRRDTRR